MYQLKGKRVLLGIGGGIAVYRTAELARLLIRAGAEVRCIMTRAAGEFVTPLTFESLTGEEVHRELFDLTREREMGHIRLARWADLFVIAPATANLMAKLAQGIADDLLTTTYQVCNTPILLAPAMNTSMWESPSTMRNIELLSGDGVHLVGPENGSLACGEEGSGRMSSPEQILDAMLPMLHEASLNGQRWVINAGPTWERWDAVRILTNRAKGTLGAHLASLAAIHGAHVTLVAGPDVPASHPLVERVDVESAAQMLDACEEAAIGADVFVGTAAVSDYRFAESHMGKMKRENNPHMQPELINNPDIIDHIANMAGRPELVIAFAAESSAHLEHARHKLAHKGVDAIVANDVANMGRDIAGGWWLTPDHTLELATTGKSEFARSILLQIQEMQA